VVLAKTLFLVQENLPAPALHATKSPVPSAHDTYYSPPQHIYITQRPNLYLTHRQKKKTKNIKHKTKKEMKRKERKTHENTKKSKKESGLTCTCRCLSRARVSGRTESIGQEKLVRGKENGGFYGRKEAEKERAC